MAKTLESVTISFSNIEIAYEIILIDDGSSQSHSKVHSRIADTTKNCIYIHNTINQGVSVARNIGMKTARFEWLLFLDSDDFFNANKISVLHRFIQSSWFRQQDLRHNVDMIAHDCKPKTGWKVRRDVTSRIYFYELLLSNFITTPSVCLRNNKYRFDENFRYMEDWKLWLEVCEQSNIIWLPQVLTTLGGKVSSGNGLSSNHYSMRKSQIKIIQDCKISNTFRTFLVIFYISKEVIRQCKVKLISSMSSMKW